MLAHPVVVTGDGARADVHQRADARVADVAEVMHLLPRAQARVFHLAVVAHRAATLEVRAGPRVRVRAHRHVILKRRAFGRRLLHAAALAHGRIAEHGVGPDPRRHADDGLPLEDGPPLDHHIGGDADAGVDLTRLGGAEGDAREHVRLTDAAAPRALRRRELDAGGHGPTLPGIRGAMARDPASLAPRP